MVQGSKSQVQHFDKGMAWEKMRTLFIWRVQGALPALCLPVMHAKLSMKLVYLMKWSWGTPISLTILYAWRLNTEREENPEPFLMNKVLIYLNPCLCRTVAIVFWNPCASTSSIVCILLKGRKINFGKIMHIAEHTKAIFDTKCTLLNARWLFFYCDVESFYIFNCPHLCNLSYWAMNKLWFPMWSVIINKLS